MKIAVLAWGSLVWDPRELQIESGSWKEDGPSLPIEFARISQDGRLTLVIYEGARDIQVLWKTMTVDSINEARENLKVRESSDSGSIDIIGYCEVENDKNQHGNANICERIRTWAKEKKLDAVIWTNLPSNFKAKTSTEYTAENIVKYLIALSDAQKTLAKEYIQKAPDQVQTEMRKTIEKELKWSWWDDIEVSD